VDHGERAGRLAAHGVGDGLAPVIGDEARGRVGDVHAVSLLVSGIVPSFDRVGAALLGSERHG